MKQKVLAAFGFMLLLVLLSGCTQPNSGNGSENGGNGMAVEKIENGNLVSVEYSGTLQDGTIFDSSTGRGPLQFTAGAGQMIKGFDKAVIGMALNEEKVVTIPPNEAYGEEDPAKVVDIPKENISDFNSLEVGMAITNNQGVNGIVEQLSEDSVVINFNHPLAGKTLNFWIKVVKIEK